MDNPSDPTLCTRLMKAYWHDRQALIDGHERMAAVMQVMAQEIRSWAPSKEDREICHLAITGVAQRLEQLSHHHH